MNIKVGENWEITSDIHGYSLSKLKKKITEKSGKYQIRFHYPSMAALCKALPEKMVMDTPGIGSFQEFRTCFEHWCKTIAKALNVDFQIEDPKEKEV
jgi:hypothetical protein